MKIPWKSLKIPCSWKTSHASKKSEMPLRFYLIGKLSLSPKDLARGLFIRLVVIRFHTLDIRSRWWCSLSCKENAWTTLPSDPWSRSMFDILVVRWIDNGAAMAYKQLTNSVDRRIWTRAVNPCVIRPLVILDNNVNIRFTSSSGFRRKSRTHSPSLEKVKKITFSTINSTHITRQSIYVNCCLRKGKFRDFKLSKIWKVYHKLLRSREKEQRLH